MRGVSRAVRRGDTFPAAGRLPPRPAPGGSRVLPDGLPLRNQLDDFEQTEHVVPLAGLRREIRVLHLSDVHLRGPSPWVDRLCAQLAPLAPDLVVLTGDVVTRGWQEPVADRFLATLPRAPLGRFAVIGNWEVWGGTPRERWEPFLARHGIPLLHDRWVDLGDLVLVGTDDLLSGSPDVEAALAGVPADRPVVALTHSPGLFPRLARPPVKLVLAGHTHAGQVRLPRLGPFFLPRASGPYPWAWYEQDGVHLFVSRGVGWSVAPVRWRCRPELAWVRMVPGETWGREPGS